MIIRAEKVLGVSGEEKLKDIKMHVCPTCGGNLNVNIERQMYECPFCGVSFDYDYFREESVLGIAAQALKNNEFTSADKAYDFMLEKEPDNFEALRGKALISMNIPKIDDIRSLDLFPKLNYEDTYKEIDRAIGSSKPQDHEYFTVMKDIVDAGHEYIDEQAQLENQRTERNKSLKSLNEIVRERDTICIYSSAKIRPKKAVILTILCYVLCCLVIFLVYKYATRNPYSKAEDLSRYETKMTESSENQSYNPYALNNDSNSLNAFAEYYSNYKEYQKALEREAQRKINYDKWEKNHTHSIYNLIWILGVATVIFALIVLMVFMEGRRLNAEISKMRAKADEQADKIQKREENIAELKDRISQGYNRLCELHHVVED